MSADTVASLLGQASVESVDRLRHLVATSDEARRLAREQWESTKDRKGEAREQHGLLSWALNLPKAAVQALEGTDAVHAAYALGQGLRQLGRSDEAVSALRKAARSEKNVAARLALWRARIDQGEGAEVLKEVQAAIKAGQDNADHHDILGRAWEQIGDYAKALDAFQAALERDPKHPLALFHLAYQCDVRGLDDEALALYERAAAANPAHVETFVNLGVMYEDRGEFEMAAACFRVVLDGDPTNPRAQLFLKDAEASLHMFYDEEQEKVADERRHLLALPISEFELSVRARNCLKKLNVETLGDLVKMKEDELLNLRNFGDTSLREVKKLLAEKGLRLGMEPEALLEYQPPVATPEIMEKSITELHLSVRAQRCMDQLEIRTVGELVSKSKTELVNSRNFGRVSLKEVMDKLAEMGLSLADG